ncbi:hypothetical protein COLO4_29977 [Corchorus olitorius]|uniref:Pentacotripeptide-repeat region of PRORP domain-containing protein n=1 Tax=Corchorus olitorius TaxID=93759 RepID=A0A1R3HC00_9ROSI|nr:hypothetical protein COLO4_29977 [Corchorus olitorius]
MEGTFLPNKPVFPVPAKRPSPSNNKPLKFSSTTLPLPPQSQSPPSLPIDSLLQHLHQLSSPANTTQTSKSIKPPKTNNSQFPSLHISSDSTQKLHQQVRSKKPTSVSVLQLDNSKEEGQSGNGSLEFLSKRGMLMLNSIKEQPLNSLNDFFDSVKFELLQIDMFSLLKALDISGGWERALLLFQWVLSYVGSDNVKLDNQVVELMVRILGRESQHEIALKLFDLIPIEESSLDVRACTTILHAFSRSGKYKRAISMFENMKETGLSPTLVTYNVMLDVYGKMGRSWSKILGLLDEMKSKGLEFDEFTCSTVISACGREGLLNEAKEFFAGLKSQGYVPGTVTYNALLQVFGKAGVYTEALSILKEMEDNNCPADSVTYNELVAAYVRAGFCEEGAAVIETMTKKGVMPNAVTYTTVINAYGKAGEEDKALALFHRMKESGCVPNVCTYNSVLGMLGKKSRSEDMVKIFCDMKASGCSPNRVTWNTMLVLCGNTGMHKYVNRVFQEMKSCGFEPDRDTFNTLISAYGRCGSEIDATKMYKEMIRVGFTPCVTTYNALLNALARRGDWKAAESVILDMKSKGFRPSETSYSLMLQSYAKGGHWRVWREHFRNCKRMDINLIWFCSIQCSRFFSKNNMYDQAHEMLHLIRESGLTPDLVTYNSLMDMYARAGECWKAEEILKGLQKSGGKPDIVSYNTVIKGFCRKGLMEEALRIFSKMTTRGIRPCIFTYNTFVAGYAAKGMFTEIDDVIGYMIQHNCRPNELSYKIVVDGYCKARRYKEAMDFVSNIKEIDNSFDDQSVERLAFRVRENLES